MEPRGNRHTLMIRSKGPAESLATDDPAVRREEMMTRTRSLAAMRTGKGAQIRHVDSILWNLTAILLAVSFVTVPTALTADGIPPEVVEQVAELKAQSRVATPILLVSQTELDALPLDMPVAWGSKPTSPEGPTIAIASPTNNATYEGPFPIKVEFLPGPKGYAVDLGSLKLEYKKAWGIDITDRVRDYITGTVIDVAKSELPSGRHTVEIEIADTEDNLSRQTFTVIVK